MYRRSMILIKNKKQITFFQIKHVIFYSFRNCYILNRLVNVMSHSLSCLNFRETGRGSSVGSVSASSAAVPISTLELASGTFFPG